MTEPVQICDVCCRVRRCYAHERAEFPPEAARKWMLRTCPMGGEGGDVRYLAGVEFTPVRQIEGEG